MLLQKYVMKFLNVYHFLYGINTWFEVFHCLWGIRQRRYGLLQISETDKKNNEITIYGDKNLPDLLRILICSSFNFVTINKFSKRRNITIILILNIEKNSLNDLIKL